MWRVLERVHLLNLGTGMTEHANAARAAAIAADPGLDNHKGLEVGSLDNVFLILQRNGLLVYK